MNQKVKNACLAVCECDCEFESERPSCDRLRLSAFVLFVVVVVCGCVCCCCFCGVVFFSCGVCCFFNCARISVTPGECGLIKDTTTCPHAKSSAGLRCVMESSHATPSPSVWTVCRGIETSTRCRFGCFLSSPGLKWTNERTLSHF